MPAFKKVWFMYGTLKNLSKILLENPYFLSQELMWFEKEKKNDEFLTTILTCFGVRIKLWHIYQPEE